MNTKEIKAAVAAARKQEVIINTDGTYMFGEISLGTSLPKVYDKLSDDNPLLNEIIAKTKPPEENTSPPKDEAKEEKEEKEVGRVKEDWTPTEEDLELLSAKHVKHVNRYAFDKNFVDIGVSALVCVGDTGNLAAHAEPEVHNVAIGLNYNGKTWDMDVTPIGDDNEGAAMAVVNLFDPHHNTIPEEGVDVTPIQFGQHFIL
jgi:hypothetical protein